MNFLKSFFAKFGNRQSTIANAETKSFASAWLSGRENSLPGLSMLTSAYQQSSWVYACVTTLAESVSSIPFRFVDKNGNPDTSAFSLQLSALFDHPHPQLDRFQFWELLVIWLCLRGEAFIYPIESSSSSSSFSSSTPRPPVEQLLILSPDCLHEIVGLRLARRPRKLPGRPFHAHKLLRTILLDLRLHHHPGRIRFGHPLPLRRFQRR